MKPFKNTAILGSIILHIVLVLLIWFLPKTAKPIKLKPQYITVVRVRPIDEKAIKEPPSKSSQNDMAKPTDASVSSSEPLRYHDLLILPMLPKDDLSFPGVASERQPYKGGKLGDLLAETSELSAHFDLPLAFRRQISQGKAWAILVLREGGIEIEYLGGDREIRAAMFESLKLLESYTALIKSFHYFTSKRIKISIQYNTLFVPQSQSEFKTERKVYDNELEITWKRYTRSPQYGVRGGSIDDKYSRRAKKRDRRHWSRLMNSPAYRKPIRQFKLTATHKDKVRLK